MTFQEVKRMVAIGESATIEFKRKIAFPEKVVKELVAFANTDGGYLFIGVNDNGSIPGLKFPEEEVYALNTAISQLCKPDFHFEQETIAISEKKFVVAYHVPSSSKKPHFVKESKVNKGQAFVRVDDKSIKASKQVREIIRRQRKNKDIKFNFGEKEKILMKYLEDHDFITLSTFRKISNVNYYSASRTLILLVLANVLKVIPDDIEDRYELK